VLRHALGQPTMSYLVFFFFCKMNTYSTINYLGLKDLSPKLLVNCAINYFLSIFNAFYTCATRFDLTKSLKIFEGNYK